MTSLIWKADCRHFRGDVPCVPHKREGVHCADCSYYDPITERILIVKLGAIGDVIRTTPLLHHLRAAHPHAHLTWLTHSPEVVPRSAVDRILPFALGPILTLRSTEFDQVINLDKDPEACALASQVQARVKHGFVLRDGVPAPADAAAEGKFLTGIFDDVSKANRKSYVEEICEIAGFQFAGEEYILDPPGPGPRLRAKHPRVGLNTGCGGRWVSRLWAEANWITLARELQARDVGVVLLGGEAEDEKNRRIAAASGAEYPGHFSLAEFTGLINEMDLVVSAVTMAMHLAIGLKKPLILFNNIFNRHEFELYGRGEILEPTIPCDCYYQPVCPQDCMQYIEVPRVLAACLRHLGAPVRR
ncbi:MAG TPA: glycosyltransferase family 9 protein [Candidatus Udaeobacter sp.]|nr:glycosyltransferase family 9 protein [Candidatus Udaeobacter sp.]